MFFDVRRGAHSVGSVVRDAACYVLWSLARTQNIETFSPFSLKLARDLIKLALFDREDSIFRQLCRQASVSREDIVRIRNGVSRE